MNQLDKFKTFIKDRNENVKVGLVGAGQMGQGIVAQVSKMYGVELVCIIDRNQKQLDSAVNLHGDTHRDWRLFFPTQQVG